MAQQITNAAGHLLLLPPPINSGPLAAKKGGSIAAQQGRQIQWRQVLGSFQITIPVKTKDVMLKPEERLLGVVKWIQKSIPLTDRWYPVFNRYVGVIGDRVKALGGDPDKIPASPGDPGHGKGGGHGEEREHFIGKVAGLIYDRFGDFAGFTLATEDGERHFVAHEPALAGLAKEAWQERILVEVVVERESPHHPETMVFLRF